MERFREVTHYRQHIRNVHSPDFAIQPVEMCFDSWEGMRKLFDRRLSFQ